MMSDVPVLRLLLICVFTGVMGLGCDRSSSREEAPPAAPAAAIESEASTEQPPEDAPTTVSQEEPDRREVSTSETPPVEKPAVPAVTADRSDDTVVASPSRVSVDGEQFRTRPWTEQPRTGPVPTSLDPGDSGLPTIDLVGLPSALRYDIAEAFEHAKAAPSDPARVGELGMYYYVADSPLAAIPCFERAAKAEPSSLRWWYYLGLAYLNAYDIESAVRSFRKAVENDSDYAPAIVELADLVRRNDPVESERLYRRALELYAADARALLGLGESKLAQGDTTAAMEHFDEALQVAPKYAAAHGAKASLLEKLGRAEEAGTHREEQKFEGQPPLANDPLLVELVSRSTGGQELLVLAERLARAGHINQAIALLQQAIDRNASELSARHALGVLLTIRGRFAEAVHEFRAVLQSNPHQFTTLVELARALARLGGFGEAEQLLREVLSTSANDPRAIMMYGKLLSQMGRSEDAVRYFQMLVQARPDYADAHWELAKALVVEQKYAAAVQSYQKSVQLGARALASARSLSEEEELDQSLERDVRPRQFVWELIRLMADQRRAEGSGIVLARRFDPRGMSPLAGAFEAKAMESAAAAVRDYERIIARGALHFATIGAFLEADRFVRIGLEQRQAEGIPTVLQLLKEESVQAPDHPGYLHLLAMVRSAIGDDAAAGELWRQLIAEHPRFELPYVSWAVHLIGKDDDAGAVAILRSGLKALPDSALLSNTLAWILATSKDDAIRQPEEAVRLAEHACALTGYRDSELLDTLAACYAAAGNFNEAVRMEQEAIKAATQIGQREAIARYRERLIIYERGIPYHESGR